MKKLLLLSLGIILLFAVVLALNGNNPPEPNITSTYTPSSETHCIGNECVKTYYPYIVYWQDLEGNWVNVSDLYKITKFQDDITFHYSGIEGYYNVTFEVGVIYNNNYYSFSEVKQLQPQIKFAFPHWNYKTHKKYAVNISNIPTQMINNIQNITLTYKDHYGFTLSDLKTETARFIIKRMLLGYEDLRNKFTLKLNKSEKRIYISNISQNIVNKELYLDPTVYYNYTDSTNNKAYEHTTALGSIPPAFTDGWAGSEISSAEYTTISASNNQYLYVLCDASNSEPYVRFNFTINETVSDITEINMTIESKCYGCDFGEYIYFYYANFTDSNWFYLGARTGTTEVTRTNQTTSGFADIIDDDQLVTVVMASNIDPGEYIYVDYAEVVVTYTVAGDTCDCPASGDWSIDCSENCVIDSACDVQGNEVYFKNTGTITTSANVYNFGQTHFSSGCIVVIGSGNKWGEK